MGCNCNSTKTKAESYVHTARDGKVTAYKSQTEADAAVVRRGGSWKKA